MTETLVKKQEEIGVQNEEITQEKESAKIENEPLQKDSQ